MSDSAERNHERIEWSDLMKEIAIYCMQGTFAYNAYNVFAVVCIKG